MAGTVIWGVFLIAVGFFALNVQRLVRYLRLGEREDRTTRIGARLWNVLTVGIFQKKPGVCRRLANP